MVVVLAMIAAKWYWRKYILRLTSRFFPSTWKSGEEETYSLFLRLGNPILGSKIPQNIILGATVALDEHFGRFLAFAAILA